MMFMIPMPPTISETAATLASNSDCTREVALAACWTLEMLRMEKSSGCFGVRPCRKRSSDSVELTIAST